MSRPQERAGFDPAIRVQLLELDVDNLEAALEAIRQELRGIRNVLVGMLVSLATASILLAISLVVQQGM